MTLHSQQQENQVNYHKQGQQQLSLAILLKKGQQLFKQFRLSQSRLIYEKILDMNSYNIFRQRNDINIKQYKSLTPLIHYDCLMNLSTICMQLNNYQQAKQYIITGIQINPQRYQGYYNLSIAYFYHHKSLINNKQITLSEQEAKSFLHKSIRLLQYSLSILYLELGILTSSLKLLNKSISLNPHSARAYIQRALYYEGNNKIKLGQNQFEKLTFENDNQQYNFSHNELIQIYGQKVLFFKRINKYHKIQENLILYHQYKSQLNQQIMNKQITQKISLILNNQLNQQSIKQSIKQLTSIQINQQIKLLVKQTQSLIKLLQSEKIKNKSLQTINQLNCHQLSLHNQSQQNISTSNPKISYQTNSNHINNKNTPNNYNKDNNINNQQQNLLQSQLPQQHSIPHHQQHPSISINEDQDSAILNQKIQELQRQIKQSGGNVPQIKDLSRNSQQQNFLQFQIQKTIQEINKKKVQDESKFKPNNQLLPGANKSAISSDKPNSIHDDNKDTLTLKSKISQTYELNLQEIKMYKSFELQIRSVTMFDQKCPKKQAWARIKYLNQQLSTQKCKNDKFTWNHNFDQILMKHSSLDDDDQSKYELNIQVHAKEGGWLSWNHEVLLGTGLIKLTEKGATKCTLQNKDKKVGMLYYKIKLNKF